MEQTNNNYPKFETGQVLTSKALNSYFGYLDEQQRLTRAQLLGVGIISGLEYKFSGGNLIIEKGTAVTTDGYLINQTEDITYTIAYKYDKNSGILSKQNPLTGNIDKSFVNVLDHVEYIFYKDEEDAMQHNQRIDSKNNIPTDIDNCIIALVIDFVSKDDITNCNELSYDIVQTNYQMEIRPVLLVWEDLPEVNKQLESQSITLVHFQETLNKNRNESLNANRPIEYFKKTCDLLKDKINYKIRIISNILEQGDNVLFDTTKKNDEINKLEPRIKEIGNTVDKEYLEKDPKFSGYFLQHLIELQMAMDEFIVFFNNFAGKYEILPINKEPLYRTILLGLGQDTKSINHRQYCTSIYKDTIFLKDRAILQKHLDRILSMSKNFNNKNDYINKIQQTKTSSPYISLENTHAKLGEQYPHDYYSSTGKLIESWEADLWTHTTSLQQLKYNRGRYGGELPNIIIDSYYGRSITELQNVLDKETNPLEIIKIEIDSSDSEEIMNEMGRIALIGGCPYNGKLYIFYTNDEERDTYISLIVGTY